MNVSIVIPSHNREKYLPRAINSVINQNIEKDIEIIIVDDASTDNTAEIVRVFQKNNNIPIVYIKNVTSLGGAAARNIGSSQAQGDYIAFLDSDDEWKVDHLKKSLEVLKKPQVKGVFGNFVVSYGENETNRNLIHEKNTTSIGDYIFTENGDTRTSTFVFEKEAFSKIKFDDDLKKHQDWDLAIRFSNEYGIKLNKEATVIIYNNLNDRMSNSNNHSASNIFVEKHKSVLSNKSLANFYTNLAINTLRFEGKNTYFKKYVALANSYCTKKDKILKLKLIIIQIPFINTAKICDLYKRPN